MPPSCSSPSGVPNAYTSMRHARLNIPCRCASSLPQPATPVLPAASGAPPVVPPAPLPSSSHPCTGPAAPIIAPGSRTPTGTPAGGGGGTAMRRSAGKANCPRYSSPLTCTSRTARHRCSEGGSPGVRSAPNCCCARCQYSDGAVWRYCSIGPRAMHRPSPLATPHRPLASGLATHPPPAHGPTPHLTTAHLTPAPPTEHTCRKHLTCWTTASAVWASAAEGSDPCAAAPGPPAPAAATAPPADTGRAPAELCRAITGSKPSYSLCPKLRPRLITSRGTGCRLAVLACPEAVWLAEGVLKALRVQRREQGPLQLTTKGQTLSFALSGRQASMQDM